LKIGGASSDLQSIKLVLKSCLVNADTRHAKKIHKELKRAKLKLDRECYRLLVNIYSENGLYSEAVLISTTMKILGLDNDITIGDFVEPIVDEKCASPSQYSPGMDILIAASSNKHTKTGSIPPKTTSDKPKVNRPFSTTTYST
jgi:hypothetical protein